MTFQSELEFRNEVHRVFRQVEQAFEHVDPDQAECENSMGALSITLGDQSRVILSAQPSVMQLWLAIASRGTAVHFNYNSKSNTWLDDKKQEIELNQFLKAYFKDVLKLNLKLDL